MYAVYTETRVKKSTNYSFAYIVVSICIVRELTYSVGQRCYTVWIQTFSLFFIVELHKLLLLFLYSLHQ